MQPQDIQIERSRYGVFANAIIFIGGKHEKVTIAGRPGTGNEWESKSDEEIQQIVFNDWQSWKSLSAKLNGSRGGQSRSAAKAASSAENGKKGGRKHHTTPIDTGNPTLLA